jgi:hypothetical protein
MFLNCTCTYVFNEHMMDDVQYYAFVWWVKRLFTNYQCRSRSRKIPINQIPGHLNTCSQSNIKQEHVIPSWLEVLIDNIIAICCISVKRLIGSELGYTSALIFVKLCKFRNQFKIIKYRRVNENNLILQNTHKLK